MKIRSEIRSIEIIGVIDDCDKISEEVLSRFSDLLDNINYRLNFEEASILSLYFPNKSCYEIEWTIIYLLEKSEDYGVSTIRGMTNLSWKEILTERINNKN